jgi:hypothetical protein
MFATLLGAFIKPVGNIQTHKWVQWVRFSEVHGKAVMVARVGSIGGHC